MSSDDDHSNRELVYCHQCENEWYKDRHGLTCPECHSDFCEVVEPDHDPRTHTDTDDDFGHIPDPDEDDITNIPHAHHPLHGSSPFGSVFTINNQPFPASRTTYHSSQPNSPQNETMSNFATMLSGILAPESAQRQQPAQRTVTWGYNGGRMFYSSSTTARNNPPMPWSPGTPSQAPTQDDTVQFDNIPDMMNHMLMQVLGGQAHPANMNANDADADQNAHQPAHPFASFMNMIFNPAAAQHGDGVYTQEAFDRVMSQLMDQNSTGNAPGPADPNEIANLPKRKVDKFMLAENDGKAECTICMDEVKLGETVTELYCGHWFHGECIDMWLRSHDTCPHCRMSLRQSKEKAKEKKRSSGSSSRTSSSPSTEKKRRRGSRLASFSSDRRHMATGSGSRPSSGGSHTRAGPSDSNDNPGLLDRARNFFRKPS